MTEFTYRQFARGRTLLMEIGGAACITIFTVTAGFLFVAGISEGLPLDEYTTVAAVAAWFLLVGWLVGLSLINHYPTVWLSEESLTISAFLIKRIAIDWQDVAEIRPIRWPPYGEVLVLARRITLSHRVYGWIYGHTLRPGFVIGRGMEHREELIAEIKRRAQEAQPHA